MTRPRDHFRCEVFRSAAISSCLILLRLVQFLGKAVVNNFDIALLVNHNVLQLEITMYDVFVVQVVDGHDELNSVENNGILLELLFIFQYFVQLAALNKWHHEIQAHFVLEQEIHRNQERVLALK